MKYIFWFTFLCAILGVGSSGYLLWEKTTVKEDPIEDIRIHLENKIAQLKNEQDKLANKDELERATQELNNSKREVNDAVKKVRADVAKTMELEVKFNKLQEQVTKQRSTETEFRNQMQNFRASVNMLSTGISTLEERFSGMSERVATQLPVKNQGDINLVGNFRFESMPNERRIILSNLDLLPENIVVESKELDIKDLWGENDNLTVSDIENAFITLSKAGYDAHLVIGKPSPVERLIWIEVYDDNSFSILHPSLEYELWNDIDNRSKVPSLFKKGEFGVYYEDGRPVVYQLTVAK